MAERKSEQLVHELINLNLDDLDVEELERRLEMSVMTGNLIEDTGDDGGGGGGGGGCGVNCGTDACAVDCGSNCVANGCGCNSLDVCGIDLY